MLEAEAPPRDGKGVRGSQEVANKHLAFTIWSMRLSVGSPGRLGPQRKRAASSPSRRRSQVAIPARLSADDFAKSHDPLVQRAWRRLCAFCIDRELLGQINEIVFDIATAPLGCAAKSHFFRLRGKDADWRHRLAAKLEKVAAEIEAFENPWPSDFYDKFLRQRPEELASALRERAARYRRYGTQFGGKANPWVKSEANLMDYVRRKSPKGRAHLPSLETLLERATAGMSGSPSYEPGYLRRRHKIGTSARKSRRKMVGV